MAVIAVEIIATYGNCQIFLLTFCGLSTRGVIHVILKLLTGIDICVTWTREPYFIRNVL